MERNESRSSTFGSIGVGVGVGVGVEAAVFVRRWECRNAWKRRCV